MLHTLRIRNLVIVEDLAVEFGPGLNVLTGETGAGKSILVDALSLVAGARADSAAVRHGEQRAVVEALFEVAPNSAVARGLESRGVTLEDGALIVRREMTPGAAGRVFVNDSAMTLGAVREACDGLLELLGQHSSRTLVSRTAHGEMLDAFGDHDVPLVAVRGAWEKVRETRGQLAELERARSEREQRARELRERVAEIDAVGPRLGERDELERERRILLNAGRAAELANGALELLANREGSAVGRLVAAVRRLRDLSSIDERFAERAARLDAARLEVEDIADAVTEFARDAAFDPLRAEAVEHRLAQLEKLFLKYGADEAEVLAARERDARECTVLEDLEAEISRATESSRAAESAYVAAAQALSEARRLAAERLGPVVGAALAELAMPRAEFSIALDRSSDAQGDRGVSGVPLSPTGAERVEFLLAANPGEPPRALGRVASGGELSRVLLALHAALERRSGQRIETLVFDEVDSGVGGAVADAVGRRLARIAAGRQVLCVTHLPQVAAYADRHYIVSKRVVDGRARAEVRLLDRRERVEEIARMLGGRAVTPASRGNAEELLRAAASARDA